MNGLKTVVFLCAGLMLSGCIAQTEGTAPAGQSSEAPRAAPPGEFDETSGAISGVVVDLELRPIVGASVALFETDFRTISAMDGTFTFSKVPPGDYMLLAAILGYEQHQEKVTVSASQATIAKVILNDLPVIEPRVEVYVFNGYITCTIGAFEVLSEECGQGLQTDVGTFGTNPNNKIDYKFDVNSVDDLEDTFIELDWQPGSAAAGQLTLYVAHGFRCTPSCGVDEDGGEVYCDTDNHGPPIQRCHIDDLDVDDPADLPWDMTARAWGAPVEATEIPNIVLEQSFTMYRTDFFGEPMPTDYSAIMDQ